MFQREDTPTPAYETEKHMSDKGLKAVVERLSRMALVSPSQNELQKLAETIRDALQEIDRRLSELERDKSDGRHEAQFPSALKYE
jgi:predicted ATP-grasp superfamily ATP-dependent carboligase